MSEHIQRLLALLDTIEAEPPTRAKLDGLLGELRAAVEALADATGAAPAGRLVAVDTGNGQCYVDLAEVVSISPAFKKGTYAPSRKLSLRGGSVEYILSTETNFRRLRHLLADPDTAWKAAGKAPAAIGPRKRGRPRKDRAGDSDGHRGA